MTTAAEPLVVTQCCAFCHTEVSKTDVTASALLHELLPGYCTSSMYFYEPFGYCVNTASNFHEWHVFIN